MTDQADTNTATDGLRITFETGPDYVGTPRIDAAVQQLIVALAERDLAGSEVEGFSLGREGSIECTFKLTQPGAPRTLIYDSKQPKSFFDIFVADD